MADKDFMDVAVEEYMGWPSDQAQDDPQTPPVDITPPPVIPTVVEPIVVEPTPVIPKGLSPDEVLQEFNKLTGLNFDNIDKVKSFAEKFNKFPELEQQVGLLPELVEALDKIQNPVNYFRDETAYKVAMLSKDPKYTGKEDIVNEILRSDLSTLNDVKIIAIAASLKATKGVRNPLRAELRGMNIDPDEVIDNYEALDEDTKDLLKIRADQFRNDLGQIGENIKVPTFEGTNIERLLNQKKAAKEDFNAKLNQVKPVAENIISEIKEIKMADDFAFKLELTPEQKKAYSDDLAEMLVSGQYDLNSDDGKRQLYGTIMDMIKADHFDKAVAAMRSHLTSKIEEDMRRKFNNEKPLDKNEPPPSQRQEEKDWLTLAAEQLVAERQ